MIPGSVCRLWWVVRHPAGRWYLRDAPVVIESVDVERGVIGFRWMDGVGGDVDVADVIHEEVVEVAT